MGLGGAILGYLGSKAALVVFTASMYTGAVATAAATPFCPPLASVSIALWAVGDASGAMLISPIDPFSTTVASSIAVASGPV
jgi:hypothetical protein